MSITSHFLSSSGQGRRDGVYRDIYPPNRSTLNIFMWLFCLLDPGQIRYRAIYTHPNQIPGYASGSGVSHVDSKSLTQTL